MTAADLQSNQRPRLRAQNDFHKIDFYFNINFGGEGLAGWAIALIVIACLAIAAAVGYIVFLKFVKGKRNAAMTEGERSLLEKEGPYSD